MSNSSESEFDLEKHFLPAWAQQPASKNPYAHFRGETPPEEREERRRRPDRGWGGGRRSDRPGQGQGRRGPSEQAGGGVRRGRRGGQGREEREGSRPARVEAPLPEVGVDFIPDDVGVDSLAKQIRMTGRAYPLFDIARMVLQKPERHGVTLSVRKNGEGQIKQPLFSCALDQSVWLSEEEAVRHVLARHFQLFYQPEKTQIDPPKGTYTFVAQCGMSGAILGPPNHHDYQNHLRKLHASRFSKMPFEVFKSRVKIVKDEETVKKWIEDQSYRTEYVCLNLPEPLRLGSREEVEAHFRSTHLANIVQSVESFQLKGTEARNIRSSELARLVRMTLENQKRFPLQVATVLSQQFAARGLQFFKVNRSITHVAVARPHFLDLEATPVSDGIKRLVQFIDGHPGCTRRQLIEGLVQASPQTTVPPAAAADGQTGETVPAVPAEPSPEETALVTDLHWLIHQGHVIEFAHGILETAKKPVVKPPKRPKEEKAELDAPSSPSEAPAGAEAPSEAPLVQAADQTEGQATGEAVDQPAVETGAFEVVAEPSAPAESQAPAALEANSETPGEAGGELKASPPAP